MSYEGKYNLIVFDLDGTLTSSHKTIYESTRRTLLELGISTELDEKKFYGMIGLHFIDIFNKLNIPVDDFEEFIRLYRSFYFEYIGSSKPYHGVTEILDYLLYNDIKSALLTTKSQVQADMIIDYFRLRKYFSSVMGRRDGIGVKPSADPLLKILEELGESADRTLIVGDTEMDIRCGKNAGVGTCAVTFGYRDIEALKAESPDFIINDILELKNIL